MRYKCIVSYDGFSYLGYQKQAHDKNTIQEVIENCLSQIFKEHIIIYGSGRTDKGVHALGQVFHFDSNSIVPEANLKKALNGLLPCSIRIISVNHVDDSFHARYSVHKKVYVYKICKDKEIDAFKARYYSYVNEKIDIDILKQCCNLLIGTHDYKNFTTNKIDEVESFVKQIYSIKVKETIHNIEITFYGSGFLRYQIRMMVGAILVCATGKKDISFITNLLNKNTNEKCSYKAEPQGLYLKKVIY